MPGYGEQITHETYEDKYLSYRRMQYE